MIKMPRGTKDILPSESYKWQYVEQVARDVARVFGYLEIRVPTFESTELFQRGVGDTTDVVQKEMYTFSDKDNRSMTLRPEGTASVVRSIIENGLYGGAMPLKAYYLIPCFRYEKPQAGRLREFHQFGIELFGAPEPAADAEVLSLAALFFHRLGIRGLRLELNSIGCPQCRPVYHTALKDYFAHRKDELCPTCLDRLEKNPLRILDCKSPQCSGIAGQAPVILDYLCSDCDNHFEKTKSYLTALDMDFTVNPHIVRGLDYYTRTVFEFISEDIGAQGTVCGGGRYDGLVEALGGKPLAGIGFALGLERLLLLMENTHIRIPQPRPADLYIAPVGDRAILAIQSIAAGLRRAGFSVETDVVGRSVKAQMKYADKIGARHSTVVGDNELDSGKLVLTRMATGEKVPCALSGILSFLTDATRSPVDAIADFLENEARLEESSDE
jgi:histidyl-tRNA synthetase